MKAKPAIVASGLGACGCILDLLLLSNAWADLGWQGSLAEWVRAFGFPNAAGIFGMVWIRLPTFLVVAVLGLTMRRLFPANWRIAAVMSGLGFCSTTLATTAWAVSHFGWVPWLKLQAWLVPYMLVLFSAAWLPGKMGRWCAWHRGPTVGKPGAGVEP